MIQPFLCKRNPAHFFFFEEPFLTQLLTVFPPFCLVPRFSYPFQQDFLVAINSVSESRFPCSEAFPQQGFRSSETEAWESQKCWGSADG